VNGRLSEAFLLGAFTSMGRRLQYTAGVLQQPVWYLTYDKYDQKTDAIYEQTRE
jgi:hypothetical protein